jgi:hypothetical protein
LFPPREANQNPRGIKVEIDFINRPGIIEPKKGTVVWAKFVHPKGTKIPAFKTTATKFPKEPLNVCHSFVLIEKEMG